MRNVPTDFTDLRYTNARYLLTVFPVWGLVQSKCPLPFSTRTLGKSEAWTLGRGTQPPGREIWAPGSSCQGLGTWFCLDEEKEDQEKRA